VGLNFEKRQQWGSTNGVGNTSHKRIDEGRQGGCSSGKAVEEKGQSSCEKQKGMSQLGLNDTVSIPHPL